MSNAHLHDTLLMLIDAIDAETDPIRRLKHAVTIQREAERLLRKARNKAAFHARTVLAGSDIAEATGYDRKQIDYWARVYALDNGLDVPGRRERQPITDWIDLRRE